MIKIITGPTASGKSEFALEVAAKENLKIINADALQLYKGLPILTACPSKKDTKRVPHLLYECVDPFNNCTVIDWLKMVETEIVKADQQVLIVGGSGFYIKALTEGLSPLPDIPGEIREQLMERLLHEDIEELYKELQACDLELALKIQSTDKQRIIRGLEVFQGTDKKLSEWQKEPKEKLPYEFEIQLVMPEREVLYNRCNERFLKMIDQGVIEEVKHFIEITEDKENALRKSLGFNELRAHLKGELELDQAIILAQTATRQFAKRQMTWFRWQL